MTSDGLVIEAAAVSLAGNARHGAQSDANWDAVLCLPCAGSSEYPIGFDFLGAVADGVSSTAQGDRASRAAVRAALRWMQKAVSDVPDERLATYEDRDFDDLLANAIRRTHDTVVQQAPDGHTTLALVGIRGDRLLCANLGDSRILRWRNSQLRQLSEVHRSAQGITRWVGGGHVEPEPALIVGQRVEPGDVLLVCSDGYYDLYSEEELREMAAWASAHPLDEVWPQLSSDLGKRMQERSGAGRHVDDATLVVACVRPAGAGPAPERRALTPGHPGAALPGADPSVPTALPAEAPAEYHPTPDALEDPMADPRDSSRMTTAIEELTAAVRLLRNRLDATSNDMYPLRAPGGSRGARGPRALPMLLASVAGLALGLITGHWWGGRTSPVPPNPRPTEFVLTIERPADMASILSESLEGDVYRLTYRSRDGGRRTLLYWTRGGGKPFGKILIPEPRQEGRTP